MKKYLAIIALCFATNAGAADLTRDDILGKWICGTKYEDINTMTIDTYEYFADGNSKSEGMVITPLSDTAGLVFQVKRLGKWSFDQGVITEIVTTESVQRQHNKDTQAELKKSKELSSLEKAFYQTLSNNPKDEADRTLKLQWTRDSNDAKRILVKQIDGTNGEGFCYRAENEKVNKSSNVE